MCQPTVAEVPQRLSIPRAEAVRDLSLEWVIAGGHAVG